VIAVKQLTYSCRAADAINLVQDVQADAADVTRPKEGTCGYVGRVTVKANALYACDGA